MQVIDIIKIEYSGAILQKTLGYTDIRQTDNTFSSIVFNRLSRTHSKIF